MEQLSDIRARVRHAEKLVGRKIQRMAKAPGGYNVSGTALDPRKVEGWINRATRKQLAKYEAELAYFRRPSVGWVSDSNGNPIARQRMKNLEAGARKRNKSVDVIESRIADLEVPWAGDHVTVGKIASQRQDKRRLRANDAIDVRTRIKERWKGSSLSSERAVNKFAKKNREMFTERAFREREGARRETFMKLVDLSPERNAIAKELESLTPEQFWFAWTTSSYLADAASLLYSGLYLGESVPDDVIMQETDSIVSILRQAKDVNVKRGTFWV